MGSQAGGAVRDVTIGGLRPPPGRPAARGAGAPLRSAPAGDAPPPNEELVNGSRERTRNSTRSVQAVVHSSSADLVRAVVLQDDVDAAQQLTRHRAHGCAPRLALVESTLEVSGQVGVRTTRRHGRQPQCSAQVGRAAFGHVGLSCGELAGGEHRRIDAGVGDQALETREAADVADLGHQAGAQDWANPLDVSHVLLDSAQQHLDLLLDRGYLVLHECDLVQQGAQLETGYSAQLGQTQRVACRGLYRLGLDQAKPATTGLLQHRGQFAQVGLGEVGGGRRLLQQRSGTLDEHVTEQFLVLGKDPIENAQCPPLSVADLVDQSPTEAGQLAQLKDRLVRHVGSASPANAYHVGDQPGILAIALDLAHCRLAIGVRLQRVEDLDAVPSADERVVQRQPVVASGFQADSHWLGQALHIVQQRAHTRLGVAKPTRLPNLLAVLAHEARLVRAFGDVNTDGDHRGDLPSMLEAGQVPDVRESSTALCVKRGGLAPHNLLIRVRSRSRGQQSLGRSPTLQGEPAQPRLHRQQPYPMVDGVEPTQLTRRLAMPTLRETLTVAEQLACAVRQHTPIQLAHTFAAFEGQFYDRLPFDDLARQVHALYAPDDADLFRSRLDRRLRDRHSAPVAWDAASPASIAGRYVA